MYKQNPMDAAKSVIIDPTQQKPKNIDRYFPSAENNTIVKAKNLACDILIRLMRIETDA